MRWFSNRSVSTKLLLLNAFLVLVMVGVGGIFGYVFQQVRVNGPLYTRIILGKDIIADIIPPPLHVSEVYLNAEHMLHAEDPSQLASLVQRHRELEQAFQERFRYWQSLPSDGQVRQHLLDEVIPPALTIFQLMEEVVLPAVERNQASTVARVVEQDIRKAFVEHDHAVKVVTELAREQNQAYEAEVAGQIWWWTIATVLMGTSALAVAVGLTWYVARRIRTPLVNAVEVLQTVARGDLTCELDVETTDEVGTMACSLNEAIRAIRRTLLETRGVANSLSSAAQQLSCASEEISAGAEQQASGLEETASSLEEITSTVAHNADNAKRASQLAIGARDVADRGGQIVTDAVRSMSEVNGAAKKISEIITVIDEIAFQTNLLALNAAVEAARAGEQGRGFAVVAGEVRNLAQRCAAAAKEIKCLIQDSVCKVESGTRLVFQSGTSLEEIVDAVRNVTEIVTEIATASHEQARGIDEISKSVAQVDIVTQSNASHTEELSGMAQELAGSAELLQAMVGRFALDTQDTADTAPTKRMPAVNTAKSPTLPRNRATPSRRTGRDAGGTRGVRPTSGEHVVRELDRLSAVIDNADSGGFEEF